MARFVPEGSAQLVAPEFDLDAVFTGRTEGVAIGRHESCPMNVLAPDRANVASKLSYEQARAIAKKVSRKHAVIYTDGEGNYFVENLSDTNGTYINGQKLGDDLVLLNDGDTIALGPPDWEYVIKFRFQV